MKPSELLQTILTGVQTANEKLNGLLEWKGAVEQRCKDRGTMLKDIKNAVFGNPTPENGLVSKVQRLLNCKQNTSQSKIDWRQFWLSVLSRLIVWGTISTIGFALFIYKSH